VLCNYMFFFIRTLILPVFAQFYQNLSWRLFTKLSIIICKVARFQFYSSNFLGYFRKVKATNLKCVRNMIFKLLALKWRGGQPYKEFVNVGLGHKFADFYCSFRILILNLQFYCTNLKVILYTIAFLQKISEYYQRL